MIQVTRRLTRLTPASIHSGGRRRAIVVEMSPGLEGKPGPGFIGFRLQGTRSTYYLPVDWCFKEAMRAELARRRAEKRKAKGRP